MARNFFKPLSEYIKSSQEEWRGLFEKEAEPELERQAEYEAGIDALQAGRFDDAIVHLKKGTGSKKYRKEAYYSLAECYQRVNMLPLARKTYERLMRLDYNYRDVQEKIRALDAPPASRRPTLTPPQRQGGATQATTVLPREDRYEILAIIHEGRHSRIYRVRDRLLERMIALKQINRDYPDRTRYLAQMKERTGLVHPNILRIYDIDEAQGQIAMEYVEGHDLRHTLRLKGTLAPKMILYIAVQLVNGLHQAHTHQIAHHALTPEHILLTRQCLLKITAFRAPDSFMRVQKTDEPYKYLYMPPELLKQGRLTTVSNIYSFGVILYELFLGKTPFRLTQLKAFLHHQAPLHYDESALPDDIRPILRRCLAIAPEQRYHTIREVGEDLIRWHKGKQGHKAHNEDLDTYKDYLLMAWADGEISQKEADFLVSKRQELHISDDEAAAIEATVHVELKDLLT